MKHLTYVNAYGLVEYMDCSGEWYFANAGYGCACIFFRFFFLWLVVESFTLLEEKKNFFKNT